MFLDFSSTDQRLTIHRLLGKISLGGKVFPKDIGSSKDSIEEFLNSLLEKNTVHDLLKREKHLRSA